MEVGENKKIQNYYILYEFNDCEIKAFGTRNTWEDTNAI